MFAVLLVVCFFNIIIGSNNDHSLIQQLDHENSMLKREIEALKNEKIKHEKEFDAIKTELQKQGNQIYEHTKAMYNDRQHAITESKKQNDKITTLEYHNKNLSKQIDDIKANQMLQKSKNDNFKLSAKKYIRRSFVILFSVGCDIGFMYLNYQQFIKGNKKPLDPAILFAPWFITCAFW